MHSAAAVAAAADAVPGGEAADVVGAAVDEMVGVASVVDAVVVVGATAADAAGFAADAETAAADVNAAEVQTFPGDVSVAAQQVSQSDQP